MDSNIKQRLAKAAEELKSSDHSSVAPPHPAPQPTKKRKILLAVLLIVITGVLGLAGYQVFKEKDKVALSKTSSVVPASVRGSVLFPVYYPDPAKLPVGFTIDRDSFSASNNAVVYSVSYDTDKKIAFTVQNKPTDDELKAFYANQIPIRNEVKTPAGTAAVGVLNDQTFTSLPTDSTAWLLITAPKDIDANHLKKVLQAIRAD